MPALHLPKAVQRWLLPRKQRLGLWWLKARLILHCHRRNLIGDFHLVIFAFISVSLPYQGFGQFLQGMEGWALLYYQRNFTAWKGPHCLFIFVIKKDTLIRPITWDEAPDPTFFWREMSGLFFLMLHGCLWPWCICSVSAVFEQWELVLCERRLIVFHKPLCVIRTHLMEQEVI